MAEHITIFLTDNSDTMLLLGKEEIGEIILKEEDGDEVQATAMKHFSLPRDMEKEEFGNWAMENLKDENSELNNKIADVKELYG